MTDTERLQELLSNALKSNAFWMEQHDKVQLQRNAYHAALEKYQETEMRQIADEVLKRYPL